MHTNGLLVIDKPSGITSRDALDQAAKWFPRKTKIGHAGTLDPLATGVLVLALGQATRMIEYVQAMPKVYRTRITLGATSDTDDADGIVTPTANAMPVGVESVRMAVERFVGEIEQVPPAYSALLVEGKRAHALARRGHEFDLAPRPVRIDRVDLLDYSWPTLELDVHCGKGTYIRAIARDLGRLLGVGGHVASLRRTRIGSFHVDAAVKLDARMGTARESILPLQTALGTMNWQTATDDEIRRLRCGQSIPFVGEGDFYVVDAKSALVAVGHIADGLFRPIKVIPVQSP